MLKRALLKCTEANVCQQVLDGSIAELEAESDSLNAAELYKKVLPFSGMGPFTAANVLQLLGMHKLLPAIPPWRKAFLPVPVAGPPDDTREASWRLCLTLIAEILRMLHRPFRTHCCRLGDAAPSEAVPQASRPHAQECPGSGPEGELSGAYACPEYAVHVMIRAHPEVFSRHCLDRLRKVLCLLI